MKTIRHAAVGLCVLAFFLGTKPARAEAAQIERIQSALVPLPDTSALGPLIERASMRRAVLLGENTHGTSEYYVWRAAISMELVQHHGFRFIAVEGDGDAWYRLRPFLSGCPDAPDSAADALRRFERWPPWMWANEETAAWLEALRDYNGQRAPEEQVFVYGLDLYGAPTALRDLVGDIESFDPDFADTLRSEYRVLRAQGNDWGGYARAVAQGQAPTDGAEHALRQIRGWLAERKDLNPNDSSRLEHLALGIRDAERHYRAMSRPGPDSWNTRADHFYAVFDHLLQKYGPDARGIAWAHNTHIGDARATPMAHQGQRNLGQTAREKLGRDHVFSVGLTGARGRVIAGRHWGGAWRDKKKPPPLPGSLEDLLQRVEPDRFLLWLNGETPTLDAPVLHRAIGVMYRPELDHTQNYVPTDPAARYDALLFFRHTSPLRALPISRTSP